MIKKETNKGGIIFFRTGDLAEIDDFYTNKIGCTLWLDQDSCRIYQHGNLLFGFCESGKSEKQGIITFFYKETKEVDAMYEKLKNIADKKPIHNKRYNIYHFYAKDPEGRNVEFQSFEHEIPAF